MAKLITYAERLKLDASVKDYYLKRGVTPNIVDGMKTKIVWSIVDIDIKRREQEMFDDMAKQNKLISAESVKRILEIQQNGRKPGHS